VRPPRNDVLLALAVAASAAIEIRFNGGVHPKWAALVTELPFSLALAWRRRLPLLAVLLLAVGWGLEPALGVPVDQPVVPLLALVIALYSLGRHLPLSRALAGFALAAAGGSVSALHIHGNAVVKIGNAVFGIVIAGGFFAVGVIVRAATREAALHARRAERLEAERALAIAEERARIARELHDVIAHSVSVMVVQAGAAAEMLKRTPERAAEPLEAVQETGRQALVEMSRLVGLLRDDAEELGLAPQPGLAELDVLLAQVRESGLPVELRVEGEPRAVPLGVDLSAYRVVQEALTNALKHAGQARAEVFLRYRPDALELEVRDDGPGSTNGHSGGHGLVGMRERVSVFGGDFEAGPRREGGFGVRARLPLEPAAT
jgi:signal transduction histidine kinase